MPAIDAPAGGRAAFFHEELRSQLYRLLSIAKMRAEGPESAEAILSEIAGARP